MEYNEKVFIRAARLIGGLVRTIIVGAVCILAGNNRITFLVNAVTADCKNTGCYY